MAVQVRLARVTGILSSPGTIAATGFTDGDTILLEVRNLGTGVTVTPPTGFTPLYSVTGGSSNEVRVYKKIANGESGNYSVSWTGGSTARLGIVAIYSDAGKPLILDGHATQDNISSSTNLPCPSITTTINGALRLDFIGINNAVNTSAGSGQTKRYDTGGTSTVAAFTQTISTAGATGTRTPTGDSAQTSRVVTVAYAELPAPSAPSGLTATAISASRIDLSWVDNSSTEDNFSLERSPDGVSGWTVINSPAANATSYSDTGLSSNTGYYYRIRAHNGGGDSAYSDIAFALTYFNLPPVSQPRLFLLQPEVVFAARVNSPDAAVYPVSFVAFDGVTTGAYTDVHDGMTILLGSSAGADDYGRQRVRGEPTNIKIYVGRSSRGTHDGELTVVDDAFLTIWSDRRVWAKIPYIIDANRTYKDSDLSVSDRTTNPPPVANCGQGFAATINSDDVIIVTLSGADSFATADGATIASYLWDIVDGTLLTGGSLTNSYVDATFPAGFRYVSLTVTDSNGKTHTAYCPVFADDPNDRQSLDAFAIESHRITDAGQQITVRALEDIPSATYPDGTLAMLWDREPESTANRDHMLIVGWLDVDDSTVSAQRTGLLRDTTLTILDVAGRLDVLPGFSQSVADDLTRTLNPAVLEKIPNINWNYMIAPTMDKYMHYLLQWHSTALDVANFTWTGTGDDYAIAIKSSDGESLWQQVKRLADAMYPGYVLTCDRAGAIAMVADPMYQEVGDRTATVQVPIFEDDWSDLRFTYQRSPRIHWLNTGALVVQTSISFEPLPPGATADTPYPIHLPTVFSRAPGTAPGQGVGETENNEGLVKDQSTLNNATGHRYARLNAPYTSLVLTLVQDDSAPHTLVPWREIEPAYKQWIELTVSAATAARRGLTFTSQRCLVKEINIRYNTGRTGMTRTVELTLELETVGVPGESVIKATTPAQGNQPVPSPIPPPDMGLIGGQAQVAAIGKFKVYRTSNFDNPSGSGGPTWDAVDLTGANEILTWVVDPFSPGYITGSGAINGWLATAGRLYQVADLFGTPTVTTAINFAHSASWRTIQASFGTYYPAGQNPWLICVSYYGSTSGHTGTWATYSIDGGQTWADEVQISAFYDSGGAINPIGLYCSPKTPGLAYTVAHLATANPATAGGFISTDWGATWTQMPSGVDPAHPLPLWGTYDDSSVWTEGDFAPTASTSVHNDGGTGDTLKNSTLAIAPPPDTKTITISGTITATKVHGAGGEAGYDFDLGLSGVGYTVLSDTNNGQTGYGQTYIRQFTFRFSFGAWATQDWPHNSDLVQADPSVALGDTSIRFAVSAGATLSALNTADISISARVDEIVLDDGTTYTPQASGIIAPAHGMAGEIHLPWENNDAEDVFYSGQLDRTGNRQFALIRAVAGTVTDVSPVASGVGYGANAGQFAIRTFDGDRDYAVAAVTGNDASSSSSGDKQGVWVSSDAGDTWTQIVAPATGTEVYQAAFGGDDHNILFVWGPAGYMKYSSNFGSSLDDRSGNLSALSATKLIGIAGGPTG